MIALYAWEEEDLFLCKDGYGMRVEDVNNGGEIDPFKFTAGLYSCGSKIGLKSLKAGA